MSNWQLWVALLVCILLAACAGGCASEELEDVEPPRSFPVKGSVFDGVILLPVDWLPKDEEVLALEEQLAAYLMEQQHLFDSWQAPIVERLPAYNSQYWGVLENGRRLIRANFFCDAMNCDWTEQEVFVLDGGDCYFRLRYDVEAGTFSDLIINGSS